MTEDGINAAATEARRFLNLVRAMQERIAADGAGFPAGGLRETGAVRRASLDLTRALAAMRKAPR